MPPIKSLLVDDLGLIWVELWQTPTGHSGQWHVTDPRGSRIADIELPRNLAVQHVSAHEIIGIWRDDSDIPYVQAYSLTRTGAADQSLQGLCK